MEIDLSKIKKILIIQLRPFGDVLLNTGYLPFLREKFPNAIIDFLVKSPYNEILYNNPNVDNIIMLKEKGFKGIIERINLFLKIHKNKYDLIIDQQNNAGSGQILFFSGAKYRIGYKNASLWSFANNINVPLGPPRYSASMKFDLLKPLGINEKPYKLQFFIKNESFIFIDKWLNENNLQQKKFICIAPGSPVQKKMWKTEYYAILADMIIKENGYKIVIVASPSEYEIAKKMKNLMKNHAFISPKTNINQAAALLKRSKMLICNDGGINHLSVSLEVPSLAIFGYTSPEVWSASEFKNHFFIINTNKNKINDSSFGLSPEMVYKKFTEVIDIID